MGKLSSNSGHDDGSAMIQCGWIGRHGASGVRDRIHVMRILLVEDEIRLARSYARNLEDGGHTVTTLHDGDAAYDAVITSPEAFDALIVDVLLPGRNGIALCRDVRRARVKTPILLLTALDATHDKVAGLDAGADDYLTKPFPFEELLARLRALARRPPDYDPAGGATQLIVDDLVIDLPRHEVYRGSRPIPLTAREFTLLEYLARNVNRVLSRGQARLLTSSSPAPQRSEERARLHIESAPPTVSGRWGRVSWPYRYLMART